MDNVVPERILLAREAREYTQKALSEAVQVTQGFLSKVENGRYPPSEEFINDIATALGFPRSFFDQQIRLQPLPSSFYRKRQNISARKIKRIEANANIFLEHLRVLVKPVDLLDIEVPSFPLDEFNWSPERAAQELRLCWNVPRGPIRNMTQLMESRGIVVAPFDFESRLFDALSIWPDGPLPIVVLAATHVPGDRLRFSLAHELGHLTMHNSFVPPDRDIEDEANRFASEFLMPATEIKLFLRRVSLKSLAQLKAHWKTSMAALLVRALQLECITTNQSQYLWKQMSRLGYKTKEPVTIERERTPFFDSIIRLHLDELDYSRDELCKTLHSSPSDFDNLYGQRGGNGSGPHLRVVR